MTEPEALLEVVEGVGRITLNRPAAINALTVGMCETLTEALQRWADDHDVRSVELTGAGERGLCAGADVRALRAAVVAGADWQRFFAVEYPLNALIARYPKPYVAHLRGVTMGGGLGLSAHGTHRLVYPDSVLAMPETIIGFTPDAGVGFHLAHAPGELGTHLGLTGASIGAVDAVAVGLADEVVGEAAPGVLAEARRWIDECYTGADAATIVQRLEEHPEPDARAAASVLRQRSPLSVAVTLEALRRAAAMESVAEVLAQDAVLTSHFVPAPDFSEGVRAQLVDKDRTPRWQHARIEDVTRDEVLAYFQA